MSALTEEGGVSVTHAVYTFVLSDGRSMCYHSKLPFEVTRVGVILNEKHSLSLKIYLPLIHFIYCVGVNSKICFTVSRKLRENPKKTLFIICVLSMESIFL